MTHPRLDRGQTLTLPLLDEERMKTGLRCLHESSVPVSLTSGQLDHAAFRVGAWRASAGGPMADPLQEPPVVGSFGEFGDEDLGGHISDPEPVTHLEGDQKAA